MKNRLTDSNKFGYLCILVEYFFFCKFQKLAFPIFWKNQNILLVIKILDDLNSFWIDENYILAFARLDKVLSLPAEENIISCESNETIIATPPIKNIVSEGSR